MACTRMFLCKTHSGTVNISGSKLFTSTLVLGLESEIFGILVLFQKGRFILETYNLFVFHKKKNICQN